MEKSGNYQLNESKISLFVQTTYKKYSYMLTIKVSEIIGLISKQ